VAKVEGRWHYQPVFFAQLNSPRKLSTYDCRETIGHFHILNLKVSVGDYFSTKRWLAINKGS
jgi:hypothetical protein